ncbi:MAG: hypothetical protein QXX41_10120 [Nitrososphaerota archaeon]
MNTRAVSRFVKGIYGTFLTCCLPQSISRLTQVVEERSSPTALRSCHAGCPEPSPEEGPGGADEAPWGRVPHGVERGATKGLKKLHERWETAYPSYREPLRDQGLCPAHVSLTSSADPPVPTRHELLGG